MSDHERIMDGVILATNTTYSLANIESTLGIILLILQIVWILSKFLIKLYDTIKRKESLDDLDDEANTLFTAIADLIIKIKQRGDVTDSDSEQSE